MKIKSIMNFYDLSYNEVIRKLEKMNLPLRVDNDQNSIAAWNDSEERRATWSTEDNILRITHRDYRISTYPMRPIPRGWKVDFVVEILREYGLHEAAANLLVFINEYPGYDLEEPYELAIIRGELILNQYLSATKYLFGYSPCGKFYGVYDSSNPEIPSNILGK